MLDRESVIPAIHSKTVKPSGDFTQGSCNSYTWQSSKQLINDEGNFHEMVKSLFWISSISDQHFNPVDSLTIYINIIQYLFSRVDDDLKKLCRQWHESWGLIRNLYLHTAE